MKPCEGIFTKHNNAKQQPLGTFSPSFNYLNVGTALWERNYLTALNPKQIMSWIRLCCSSSNLLYLTYRRLVLSYFICCNHSILLQTADDNIKVHRVIAQGVVYTSNQQEYIQNESLLLTRCNLIRFADNSAHLLYARHSRLNYSQPLPQETCTRSNDCLMEALWSRNLDNSH